MINADARSDSARALLEMRNLTVHYDARPAIADVSLDVFAGETVSLLGPNGAGKSTLLKVIAGMLPASHGSVHFNGSTLGGANPSISYIPQRAGADWSFPISVLEAVELGLPRTTPRWRGFSHPERARARAALDQVGMDTHAGVQIGALSGGQQQRVFLARALLDRGSILLLDEPFTGVDVPTQELFVTLFDEFRAEGTAIVYATHDLAQAARTSDRVVLLNRQVIAAGPPGQVMIEETLRETFGGQVLFLTAPKSGSGTSQTAVFR
jgi:manganese/zinc/iron transport system ATP- binding protein